MKAGLFSLAAVGLATCFLMILGCSQEVRDTPVKPALVQKDGITHFEVDGKPFLIWKASVCGSR